jgi:hypothetical protein
MGHYLDRVVAAEEGKERISVRLELGHRIRHCRAPSKAEYEYDEEYE